MQTDEFDFDLPDELIAQKPSTVRGNDKLLVLDSKTKNIVDCSFEDFINYVPKDALLVFNDSRVRKARTFAKKVSTGAKIEFLFLHPMSNGKEWRVLVKRAKRQRVGETYIFEDGTSATLFDFKSDTINSLGSEKVLIYENPLTDEWFEKNGHIPLPPYIKRLDSEDDAHRYQNVYATHIGSVACPTAGLHFNERLLDKLDKCGIKRVSITLHVGLGTFLPVHATTVEEHTMHSEEFFISEEVSQAVEKQKREGKPILAIGTTSVRALETAFEDGHLKTGWQSSKIFIYPPYTFKVVDMLLTNFHTPKSTLLMLVSALAGKETIFEAYKHAIQKKYRFFSYGDAMLIL